MAKAILEGGTYKAEIAEVKGSGLIPPKSKGIVDPDSGDPNNVTAGQDETIATILKWAERISGVPSGVVSPAPREETGIHAEADARFARLVEDDEYETVYPNGIAKRVPRAICRCPIIAVGDFCPVHGG